MSCSGSPGNGDNVTTLPDLSNQLRSGDTVGGCVPNARFGVGRQLIAWRAAELAVTTSMMAQGANQGQIDQVIGQLSSAQSVIALAQLPAGTPPIEVAEAARLAAALPARALAAGREYFECVPVEHGRAFGRQRLDAHMGCASVVVRLDSGTHLGFVAPDDNSVNEAIVTVLDLVLGEAEP
jgi:hypothetical protein